MLCSVEQTGPEAHRLPAPPSVPSRCWSLAAGIRSVVSRSCWTVLTGNQNVFHDNTCGPQLEFHVTLRIKGLWFGPDPAGALRWSGSAQLSSVLLLLFLIVIIAPGSPTAGWRSAGRWRPSWAGLSVSSFLR